MKQLIRRGANSYPRQHVHQWRRLHPQLYSWQPAPSIGTVATVYNRTNLRTIVSQLRSSPHHGSLDLDISKYRVQSGLAGYLLEPNLVRHVGRQSSMGESHQVNRDNGDTREFLVNYSI